MNGGTQSYKTLSCSNDEPIGRSSTAVKLVLVGPNVKIGGTTGNFKVSAATGVTALLPRSSGNTTWDAVTTSTIGGTNPTIVRYGPNEECGYDFWMGTDTITAVPRTLSALATVNGYASTFKTSFFLDTRYAVTNAIGTLTSDIYSGAGIDVKGVGKLTFGLAAAFTGGVTASDSATVAVNAGCRPGNGAVTLNGAATLKVAQSGTVTLGGALSAANGTSLAFDLEWNSKDQTFDRDLLAMRTYFDCGLIDVGIILTRAEDLNDIFRAKGLMAKYGASTTWMGKLLYRLKARRNGGCPILAVGIKKACVEGFE